MRDKRTFLLCLLIPANFFLPQKTNNAKRFIFFAYKAFGYGYFFVSLSRFLERQNGLERK